MAVIKLKKRIKFAGDVFDALMKKGWSCTDAADFVNSFPDAEAAEGVLCQECEFYKETKDWDGRKYFACHKRAAVLIIEKKPDDFCSDGERRDNAVN